MPLPTIRSTKDLLSPDTRICELIYAPAKFGKTKQAAALNDLTVKYRGKPSIFIACERADGGGTMTLNDLAIDYLQPANWGEMEQIIAWLATDTKYGGVILDNATDYAIQIVKPHALSLPNNKEKAITRTLGVPGRSDYQVMGELGRGQLNRLVNLTNQTVAPAYRKDLIVTALEKTRTNDDGMVTEIVPDLPGALSGVVTAMFQTVVNLRIKDQVDNSDPKNPKRYKGRYQQVRADGLRISDDRTGIFKDGFILTTPTGEPVNGLMAQYEPWLAGWRAAHPEVQANA